MDTRGLRHLKSYLGKEGEHLARAKRASDVVPVLAARQAAAAAAARAKAADLTAVSKKALAPLSPSVMQYLEGRLSSGATHKLSRTQMTLTAALAAPGSPSMRCRAEGSENGATAIAVTRAKVADMAAAVDTLAVSALELTARRAAEDKEARRTTAESSSLFVLVDTSSEAAEVAGQLEERYGLTLLLLTDDKICRHPTFPSPPSGAGASRLRGTTSKTPAAERRKTKSSSLKVDEVAPKDEVTESTPALAGAVVVVVATPGAFLAVDRRSAIWKFIGSCALLLRRAPTHTDSLLHTLKGIKGASSSPTTATPHALNAQRWDCLHHVPAFAVLAAEQEWLTEPELDLLTTLRVERSLGSGVDGVSKSSDASVSSVVAALRSPVTVHYAVAQGAHRFQFLFGLLKGLAPHRGIVVHVATRECVAFLYDTLYSLLGELPSYVQLLSDYEGASAYTNMHTTADRQRLCVAFDSTVESGKNGKTAAVLLSCHGLVPQRGSTFLQYDIIPDLLNYNEFIAEVLSPGAVAADAGNDAGGTAPSAAAEVVVRRERTARQRKRSTSPTPAPVVARRVSAEAMNTTEAEEASLGSKATSPAAVNYTHILLLFRPNEVAGALRHLRRDGASRYRLEFRDLGTRASGRYFLIGEKLKSMNKKLFLVQNAAYYAYKATMRTYSTIGPRDVYDETKVNLEKVAEEFGYTELPLLDLRLKDTVFRPKEDYYRAARQKQDAERRAYKTFAQRNIIGESPEEHVADDVV
ncbi:conserved hypothetical protein [Leishmania mexicana MHOM/GT/2001/U1103]|uniref:Uncharacterized protein n=1 Tax=Leishmania mexicana (strain MHOM/GT/2001/U1103) TaxID=929439 RepID=E9B1P8_LEIMU|nr:conserved hypothetical protein [Leishmania mexicana MHOM/GT/2001/U1103]CBZ29155.1 conserved hypothetical protein [Leishmania mexicana MHOM/GT/2001/U1103]